MIGFQILFEVTSTKQQSWIVINSLGKGLGAINQALGNRFSVLPPSIDLLLPVNVSELKNISILLDVFDHVINIPAFLNVGVVNLITHVNVPEVAIGAVIS